MARAAIRQPEGQIGERNLHSALGKTPAVPMSCDLAGTGFFHIQQLRLQVMIWSIF